MYFSDVKIITGSRTRALLDLVGVNSRPKWQVGVFSAVWLDKSLIGQPYAPNSWSVVSLQHCNPGLLSNSLKPDQHKTTRMPASAEQYHPDGGPTVIPAHRLCQYISPYFPLTYRQSKAVISRNPLHRVRLAESKSTHRKVKVMPPQNQNDDRRIPPAASNWKKGTLDLLNAKFDSRSLADFMFDGFIIPNELQIGIVCHSFKMH